MRTLIITSIISAAIIVLGTGCTTTKIVVVTPTAQGTPTFTADQQSYMQSVATQMARPTDTPIPPAETPVPPTPTPVVIYVPAALGPTVPPPSVPPPAPPVADGTISQQNALKKAESYLQFTSFSRSGLIHQLEFEGFSTADATWGVDRLNVDWKEQATKQAESYLQFTSFSRSGLIHQLEFEGFSTADATWGVDRLNVDWNEQAAKKAKEYLRFTSFSRSGLIEQLEFEGFTPAQAEYGVSQTGL